MEGVRIKELTVDINSLKDGGIREPRLCDINTSNNRYIVFGDTVAIAVGSGEHFIGILKRQRDIRFIL